MNINQKTWDVIKVLMEESFWGRNSSYNSLIKNLSDEMDEFIQGSYNNDINNSIEEAADVLMIMLCILYKINGSENTFSIDEILNAITNKLMSRYKHLYENTVSKVVNEKEIWNNAKQVEDIVSYMLCPNKCCEHYGEIGGDNIKAENNCFRCCSCNKRIRISSETVLFYNKKYRRKYVQVVIKYILLYVKGNSAAPEIFKTDELVIYNYFCKDILKSKNKLKEHFVNYVSKKYKLDKEDIVEFCNIAMKMYDIKTDEMMEYCKQIEQENYMFLKTLTNEERNRMKNKLSNVTMDIVKRIEKVATYRARNWDNQLVHKYLLSYKVDGINRIIECMTIIHYQGEKVRDLTIELSNMYNCVVGCRFCASAALPETTYFLEPIDYVRQLNTCIKESGVDPSEFENFYVSFAGIGEPSVVHRKIADGMIMIRDLYPNVKFNIATFGFNSKCFNYWKRLNLPIRTLQIPFYSYKEETLKYIVQNLPDSYNFEQILLQAIEYKNKYLECRIKVNFIAMKDINDSLDDVAQMCQKLKPYKDDIVIKISFLNYTKPGEENNIIASESEQLEEIENYIKMEGFSCYIFGTSKNIEVGCGQLAQNHISSN